MRRVTGEEGAEEEVLSENLLPGEQPQSLHAITKAVKCVLSEEDEDRRHHDLRQLPQQGEMARMWDETSPVLLVKAPPEPLST